MKFTSSTSSIHLLSVLASFTFLAQAQPLEKRLPNGPSGSRLVQFSPSSACQTSKTIPMFVNKAWSSDSSHPSQATHAIIVQHGLGRDVNNAFSDVYPVIGDQRVLVAPGFNLQSDSSNPGKYQWYTSNENLAWYQSNDWMGGADAIDSQCSTYDVYDSIIQTLSDKSRFPSLNQLSVIGHSNGGAFISRFALLQESDNPGGFKTNYVEANAPSHAYMTKTRPSANIDEQTAPGFNSWPYGLEHMPRYPASRMQDARSVWARYVARDSTSLIGTIDNYALFHFGDQSPASNAQGGTDRDQRNYAWWAYKVLLSGANVDVSKMWGFKHLSAAGAVESWNAVPFNHKNCIVPGVGHVAREMFASSCGRDAILGIDHQGGNGNGGKQHAVVTSTSQLTSTSTSAPTAILDTQALLPAATSSALPVSQIISSTNNFHHESNTGISLTSTSTSVLIFILSLGHCLSLLL